MLETKKTETVGEGVPEKDVTTIKEAYQVWGEYISRTTGGGRGPINPALPGYYYNYTNNPYLLNNRIKRISSRPEFLERDKIEDALVDPGDSELLLRNATHSMLYMTYPMYRLQMLYEGILTYRSYIQPLYVPAEDMSKRGFKFEEKFLDQWHKKLAPEKQFRKIVGQVMAEGKKAYYLRQNYKRDPKNGKSSVDYVYFQELPSDWYKIIKNSTDSFEVVAFNFTYFWNPGTDLGQFPAIFTKYYMELESNTVERSDGRKVINTDNLPEKVVAEYNAETMEWFYWMELPADECFVFCFTETDNLQVSPFISLLLQAQDLSSYSLLQQQLLSVPLYSILVGEVPMSEHNKSGSYIDDYALSPDSIDLFEMKVNGGLPPGTRYAMTPSKNNQLFNFQEVPNANEIYAKGLQDVINTSGASTLMTTTNKPSVAQVNAGKVIEKRYVDRVYEQFSWAINIVLNRMMKRKHLKYDWHFRIFGGSFDESDQIAALEGGLALGQTYLLPDYLAYRGKTLLDATTAADWVESSGIYDKFKPLVNSFTSTNKEGGRPQIEENKIDNDDTAASRDSGLNTAENRFSGLYLGDLDEDELMEAIGYEC